MMVSKHILRNLVHRLPNSRLKQWAQWAYYARAYRALRIELSRVPIVESGWDDESGAPFVVLSNGTILYGREPTEFQGRVYSRWRNSIVPTIGPETVGVAIDVICRYLYPHAMPQVTMPYPRRMRRAFHPQHVETIEDLPRLSRTQKDELVNKFAPRPGESFLDVGSYIGYGTIRMSEYLGPEAKIIAVEPDPDNFSLLRRNISVNGRHNVTIIPKAIWNGEGKLELHRGGRQATSLVDSVVSSSSTVRVQTTAVDLLLSDLGLSSVDIASITINGAEVEAIEGMINTLETSGRIRLTIAGWYKRDGQRICDILLPVLRAAGLKVVVGRDGGILAWRD
jgi:FkbM family methyltransferase